MNITGSANGPQTLDIEIMVSHPGGVLLFPQTMHICMRKHLIIASAVPLAPAVKPD